MGFPGGTINVPGPPRPDLADVVAAARVDPYGDGARLEAILRDGAQTEFGHLATNAWVLDANHRLVLLVRHRALGWVSPGGHVNDGELPAAGAARELKEETGLALEPCYGPSPVFVRADVFPARGTDPAHWHWNLHYLFVADPSTPLTPEDGAPLAWYPINALPEPAVPDLADSITIVRSRQLLEK